MRIPKVGMARNESPYRNHWMFSTLYRVFPCPVRPLARRGADWRLTPQYFP